MTAIEFSVGGQTYRAEKLDTFNQWDVARRLAPLVAGSAGTLIQLFRDRIEGRAIDLRKILDANIENVLAPITKALATLPDADSRFVITTCLSVVKRREGGGSWAPVTSANGALVYQDIDLPTMVQIVWKVVEHDLLNFFSGPSRSSVGAGRN